MGRLSFLSLVAYFLVVPSVLAQDAGERDGAPLDTTPDAPTGGPAIVFDGNDTFTDDVLLGAAARELRGIRRGEGSPADLVDAAYTIETWYADQGFPDANVRVRMVNELPGAPDQTVADVDDFGMVDRVDFLVAEGQRLYLGRVEFEGNNAFADAVLEQYVPRRGGAILGAGRPLFRPGDVGTITDNVRLHYLLAGYLRVRLEEPRTTRDGNQVNVTITIEEGRLYTIETIRIEGIDELSESLAQEVGRAAPETGVPYTERRASDGANAIERLLGQHGYLTDVRYELVPDDEEATVAVRYRFDPGDRAYLGSIRVEAAGDEPLRVMPAIVRHRFPLAPGEPIDLTLVNEGRQRLYQTGLFRVVSTELREAGGDDASAETTPDGRVVDLVVTLEEDRNRYVELAAGWSSVEQILGSIEYVDRNVLGTGRLWGVEASGSLRGYRFSTRVVDRIVLGLGSLLSFRIEHAYRIREAFRDRSTAADLRAEIRLAEELRVAADYQFSISNIVDLSDDGGGESTLRRVSTLAGILSWNTVDDPLLPMHGSVAELGTEITGSILGSQLDYVRADLSLARHFVRGTEITLTLAARGTAILPFGVAEIPISERLYAGGTDSVRSFPLDQLSPTDASGNPVGGLTRIEATAEARLGLSESLFAAFFYDVGMVAADALSLATPGHGIGLGVRYRLPVGPVRLDVAVNPGPTFAAEAPWAFHFSIGAGF